MLVKNAHELLGKSFLEVFAYVKDNSDKVEVTYYPDDENEIWAYIEDEVLTWYFDENDICVKVIA